MRTLCSLGLSEILDRLQRREISARELCRAYLTAMERSRDLNAFILETPERALADADAADVRLQKGEARPLEGVPLAVKDVFCTKNIQTTAASDILRGFVPAYESFVTDRLWKAGAVLLGKTNMDEFAMGSANLHSAFGPVVNPWSRAQGPRVVPGGSSGGSAAALASGCCAAALGSDTGGSIRQPAAFCGLVGLKPGYGRCSRWGMIAFASSLDQAGPIARNVEDAARLFSVISGHDSRDSTSVRLPPFSGPDRNAADVNGLKVGIPREYREIEGTPLNPEIARLWMQGCDWLAQAGAEIHEISMPHTQYALAAYYVIAPTEASSNLARYDGVRYTRRAQTDDLLSMYKETRTQGFGAEVRRRILIGTYALSSGYYEAYYDRACRVRSRIAQDFTQAFDRCDVLLTPTVPCDPFPVDAPPQDVVSMYRNDIFTVPASLAGLPAISVPAGLSVGGMPLGLQLIAAPFDEATLLRVAAALEQSADFDRQPPYVRRKRTDPTYGAVRPHMQ